MSNSNQLNLGSDAWKHFNNTLAFKGVMFFHLFKYTFAAVFWEAGPSLSKNSCWLA